MPTVCPTLLDNVNRSKEVGRIPDFNSPVLQINLNLFITHFSSEGFLTSAYHHGRLRQLLTCSECIMHSASLGKFYYSIIIAQYLCIRLAHHLGSDTVFSFCPFLAYKNNSIDTFSWWKKYIVKLWKCPQKFLSYLNWIMSRF